MSKLKHFIVTGLCAAIGATAAVSAHAWDLWDAFKTASVDNARVVDRSDERKITTSEGPVSYTHLTLPTILLV